MDAKNICIKPSNDDSEEVDTKTENCKVENPYSVNQTKTGVDEVYIKRNRIEINEVVNIKCEMRKSEECHNENVYEGENNFVTNVNDHYIQNFEQNSTESFEEMDDDKGTCNSSRDEFRSKIEDSNQATDDWPEIWTTDTIPHASELANNSIDVRSDSPGPSDYNEGVTYENYSQLDNKIKNTPILDEKYFKVVGVHDKNNIKALCQLCLPVKKIVKGSAVITTNFLKHLRRVHPVQFEEYERCKEMRKERRKRTLKEEERSNKRVRQTAPSSQNEEIIEIEVDINKETEQRSATENLKQESVRRDNHKGIQSAEVLTQNGILQSDFDDRIVKFIVNSMPVLSIVENRGFIKLFEGVNVDVLSKNQVMSRISQLYDEQSQALKSRLKSAENICMTVDLFGLENVRFFAVTVHLLDTDFSRYSAVVICKRFSSKVPANIAEILEDANLKFGINEKKIVSVIVGNTYNFNLDGIDISENLDCVLKTFKLNIFKSISGIINNIVNIDIVNDLKISDVIQKRHEQTFLKLQTLWNKLNESKCAEIIQRIVGHDLVCPKKSWTSRYNAITQLLHEKNSLPIICNQLELPYFKETEIKYLKEYLVVLKPFYSMLQVLDEENSYLGYLLPSLISVKNKLEKLKAHNLKYGGNVILNCCLRSLMQKFKTLLNYHLEDAVISAVLCPNFKLRWFVKTNDVTEDTIKKMIIAKAEQSEEPYFDSTDKSDTDSECFFDFNETKQENYIGDDFKSKENNLTIELQLLKYLDDSRTNIEMLNDYPILKKLFLKYNTCLPSSGHVENLFSYETMLNAPIGEALSDDMFEKLVILKANKFNSL